MICVMVRIDCDADGCERFCIGHAEQYVDPLASSPRFTNVVVPEGDGWWHERGYARCLCPEHAPKDKP